MSLWEFVDACFTGGVLDLEKDGVSRPKRAVDRHRTCLDTTANAARYCGEQRLWTFGNRRKVEIVGRSLPEDLFSIIVGGHLLLWESPAWQSNRVRTLNMALFGLWAFAVAVQENIAFNSPKSTRHLLELLVNLQ